MIIPTFNEAELLRNSLESVKSAVDQIVAVDSSSTDETLNILRDFSAKILTIPFNGSFADLRNAAIEACDYDWIFVLDADETIDKETGRVIRNLIEWKDVDAFCLNRKNYVNGWLCQYPDYHFRLFRDYCRYVGKVHEYISGYTYKPIYLNLHIVHIKTSERQAKQTARYNMMRKG